MFKRSDDDEIPLSDARERMRRLLGARPADVTTTCTEPGVHKDRRVVRGTGMCKQAGGSGADPIPMPTRRDVLAAISDTLALCRAVGADVAEIEIGLSALFNEATAGMSGASGSSTLPKSRRLSEQFESDVN